MIGATMTSPERIDVAGPLVFLAGPIQGAHDWQSEAIRILRRLVGLVHLANPRRALARYENGDFSPELYAEQVDWETYYLRRTARDGCLLFWLAKEADHRCDRAYAQTTRFELAEWKICHERDGVKLALGIEEGFTGARYIRRRFAQDCPGIAIRSTLEETCADAVRLAQPAGFSMR